ncbi:AAA family ATPase [Hymenobacter sp. 5516J-16]|uniref:AAA family ATPase n=1 Tax=Hymenobacter sp. 5516J-16 TaxID=2932253 RepID=UPI001FD1BD38|nr:AAA family ATPase [Hymenobacter sp. 5516J-16]UOQ76532.1 AAA family ATPase [Hymenobacter sp. 5516J-16]
MQRIKLDNFRVFGFPAEFDLAPVTVLTGKNNSGKSSLIKAFLILADYLEQDDQTVLRLDGPRALRHKISGFDFLKNWEGSNLRVQLGYSLGQYQFEFEFGPHPESANLAMLNRFRMVAEALDEDLVLERVSASDNTMILLARQSFIDFIVSEEVYLAERSLEAQREAQEQRERLAKIEGEIEKRRAEFEKNPDLARHQAVASAFAELNTRREDALKRIRQFEEYATIGKTRDKGIVYHAEVELSKVLPGSSTLSRIIQQALISYVEADNTRKVKYFKFRYEEQLRSLVRFEQELALLMRFSSAHLGPNRTYQARLYFNQQAGSEIAAVVESFIHNGIRYRSEADKFLRRWLPQFNVGDSVNVEQVEGMAFKIAVSRKTTRQPVNLADLGFGAGQVLTILLQIASIIQQQKEQQQFSKQAAARQVVMLIEEPEANLHPRLQSLLAQMFAETANEYGLHFVIESHSEYLIRKLQLLVATEACAAAKVLVYYLDQDMGHRRITILPDGKLSEAFGSGFFDEADESAMHLFRAQKKAARTQS